MRSLLQFTQSQIPPLFFDRQLLLVFGAKENLLPFARRYIVPIKFAIPFFLFNQILAAFLEIDGIWISIVAADIMSVMITVFFIVKKREKYHYI